jgi:hypothetical protein
MQVSVEELMAVEVQSLMRCRRNRLVSIDLEGRSFPR